MSDDAISKATVDKLLEAFEALGGGGRILPQDLSPRQKVGLIILARAIVHQRRNFHTTLLGMTMIELLSQSEWPDQPMQKSSVELLYRSNN